MPVAIASGAITALVASAFKLWRGGPEMVLFVALTLVMVVLAGRLIGISLPFLLDR